MDGRGDQDLILPGSGASCIFPPCSSSPKPMLPRSALSLIKRARIAIVGRDRGASPIPGHH